MLYEAFGRTGLRVELQRPLWRGDRARNRRLLESARLFGLRLCRDERRARARPAARRAAGCDGRHPHASPAGGLRGRAPRQPRARAQEPARDGSPVRRPARGHARDDRAGRAAALRPHAGSRLPLPGGRRHRGRRRAGADLRARAGASLPRPLPPRRGARAARRGARADPLPRPLGLLPAAPRDPRDRARDRDRGARPALGAHGAAAGPRPGLVGRLDRLLPHRPLARGSGRGATLARPLPQPRAGRSARHRPRLPARHPREADPGGARPFRARAQRADRGVLDLPLAQRDPRARQGAGPAAARSRPPGTGLRRLPRRARRRGARPDRRRARALPRPSLQGARRTSAGRSPACRATSRSTPAG